MYKVWKKKNRTIIDADKWVENTKAFEVIILKELGKLLP